MKTNTAVSIPRVTTGKFSHVRRKPRLIAIPHGLTAQSLIFAHAAPAGDFEVTQNRLLEIHDEHQAILAKAQTEGRDLTTEEQAKADALGAEFDRLSNLLPPHQGGTGRRVPPSMPGNHAHAAPAGSARHGDQKSNVRIFNGTAKSAVLFPKADMGGWKDADEWLGAIFNHRADPRLISAASMSEGVGVDGGFMVPAQLYGQLLDLSLESEIVRPRALVVPMTSNAMTVPLWNDRRHDTGPAGLTGVWLGEGGTATRQVPKLTKTELKAHKFAIFTQASSELAEDGYQFASQLEMAMTEVLGFDLDYAFLWGNGVAKPLGIMKSNSLITVSPESGQLADTIVLANVLKMFSRLQPGSFNKSVWLAHPSTIPQLMNLQSIVQNIAGTENVGGASVPVFQLLADGSALLLTRPVVFTEKVSKLGDKGDLILADFSKYLIGLRRVATLQMNLGPGWTEDAIDYRLITRVEGRPIHDTEITPKLGTETLSPFVTLGDRE